MNSVLCALLAELLQFQAIFQDFLILRGSIVERFARGAFHFDEGILGHTKDKNVEKSIRELRCTVNLWRTLAE